MTPPSEIKAERMTANGTAAVCLKKNPSSRGGVVKNLSYLSGQTATTVYVGGSDVSVINGYPLDAGESISTQSNAAIYVITAGTDVLMASFTDRAAATVAT